MRGSFEKTTNYRNGGLRNMPVQQAIIFAAMASDDDKLPFDVSMIHPAIRTQVFNARDTLKAQREVSKTAGSAMKPEFKPPWSTWHQKFQHYKKSLKTDTYGKGIDASDGARIGYVQFLTISPLGATEFW